MLRRSALIFTTMVFAIAFSAVGMSGASTTLDRTIVDSNGDNRLEFGPGDPALVRTDLGGASPNRASTRRRLFTFAQISDFQTVDEESPLRVEDMDNVGLGDNVLGSAYRPQESLGLQTTNSVVKKLNGVMSTKSKGRPELVVVTGDNADNMQENETEWYIDVLDGDTVNPNSGDSTYDPGWECFPSFYPTRTYQGVRDGGNGGWYEPDGDGLPGQSEGHGYSSDWRANFRDVGRNVASRNFPGLFERAQQPFSAAGLEMPWVTVFGNHDALVWGTFTKGTPAPPYFADNESFATGCFKDVNGNYPDLDVVEPDRKRHLLGRDEWIAKHFDSPSSPGPVGHGFSSRSGPGYYAYDLTDKLRLIGLDSVNTDGLHNGTIRDGSRGYPPQWEWLGAQLDAANRDGKKVIVTAHHSLRTMNNMDTFGWQDQHCGLIESPPWPQRNCPSPSNPGNESLESLFYRKGNVVAYIAGHEHDNNIEARRQQGGPGRFWEITTVSEVDWPQQSSLLEIYDNRDGSWSIFRTLVDHNAAVDPGVSPNLNDPDALASISRELSFNDPQGGTGEDGTEDRRGEDRDRNVELLLDGFNRPPRCDNTSSHDLRGVQQVFRVPCDDGDSTDNRDTLTYEIVMAPPAEATASFTIDSGPGTTGGRVTYSPNPSYTGTFTFTYKACDDGVPTGPRECSDPATATVTVLERPNQAPICWDLSVTVPPVGGAIQSFNLTCYDAGPPPLTYEIVADPPSEINTLYSAGSNGAMMYVPEVGDPSPFTFTFRACDGGSPSLCSADATATVSVAGGRGSGRDGGGDGDSGGRGGGIAGSGGKQKPPISKHGGTRGRGFTR